MNIRYWDRQSLRRAVPVAIGRSNCLRREQARSANKDIDAWDEIANVRIRDLADFRHLSGSPDKRRIIGSMENASRTFVSNSAHTVGDSMQGEQLIHRGC